MRYDIEKETKEVKKSCFVCLMSPENILMLACDDSICLECAFKTLKQSSMKKNSRGEIEFKCRKCNEITFFDNELVKEIEKSVFTQKESTYPQYPQKEYIERDTEKGDESFIEKMKRQYLVGEAKNKSQEKIAEKKDLLNKTNDIYQSENQIKKENKFSLTNEFFQDKIKNYLSNGKFSNENSFKAEENFPRKNSLFEQQEKKCKTHSYYDLIYYCVECQEIVCSECLLRGKHKGHRNESINEILEKDLPEFINKTSEKLLAEINKLESIKESKYSELNLRVSEIRTIKENAEKYFSEVKKNLEREENEVLQRCEEILKNLLKEEQEIQVYQKDIELQLAFHVREIKSLKFSYKEFLGLKNDQNSTQIQNSLIGQFIKCSNLIDELFNKKPETKENRKVENESTFLNKKIEKSIESIRESLLFDPFSKKCASLINEQKHKSNESEESRLSYLKPREMITNVKSTKTAEKPPISQYISYLATDKSPNKNKNIGKEDRSLTISPYKGESSFYKHYNQPKSNIPKQIHKQVYDIEKENIYIQPLQKESKATKLPSEASSQNVSLKKYSTNQSKNSSISKSKNNSITKKKQTKITNNLVAKFQL